jgi:hypothetical protein
LIYKPFLTLPHQTSELSFSNSKQLATPQHVRVECLGVANVVHGERNDSSNAHKYGAKQNHNAPINANYGKLCTNMAQNHFLVFI